MDRQPNYNFQLTLKSELLDQQQVSYLWKFIASEFNDAADRCAEDRNVTSNGSDYYPIAAGVLLSLSIELYLKYLISEEDSKGIIPHVEPNKLKSHDLSELFNILDKSTQDNIIWLYFHEYREQTIVVNVLNKDEDETEQNQQIFNKLLNQNKKMFEEWRYIYENNQNKKRKNKNERAGNLSFMKRFGDSIQSVINNSQD